MKTAKAAARKAASHRTSKQRKVSVDQPETISSGGDVESSRRHTVSVSESKAIERKKKREAKLAERQRYTIADLTSLSELSQFVSGEENGANMMESGMRDCESVKTSGSSSRRESVKSDGNSQDGEGVEDEMRSEGGSLKQQLDARAEFFRTFSRLIKMGTQRQRQREQSVGNQVGVTQRHMSQPVLSVSSPQHRELSDSLWLELQAYLDCRSLEAESTFLSEVRFNVGSVLNDIMSFTVKKSQNTPSQSVPLHAVDSGNQENLCVESSVLNTSDGDNHEGQNGVSNDTDERCVSHNGLHTDGDDVALKAPRVNNEVASPPSSSQLEQLMDSDPDALQNSRSTSRPIDLPQSQHDRMEMKRQRRLSEKSQESDIASPSSSINLQGFISDDQFPNPASCITPEQLDALESVRSIMSRLEKAQSYYPNLSALAKDYPLFESETFDRRIKSLNLWYNVMQDLHFKIKLLTVWMDVRVDLRPFSMKTRFLRMQAARRFSLQPSKPQYIATRQSRIQSESLLDDTAAQYYQAMSLPPEILTQQAQSCDLMESETVAEAFRDDPELLEHLFPSVEVDVDEGLTSRYRKFVDKSLKQMGLSKLMNRLSKCLHRTLKRAHNTLVCRDANRSVSFDEQLPSMMEEGLTMSPLSPPLGSFYFKSNHQLQHHQQQRIQKRRRSSQSKKSIAGLTQEFVKMGLPSFKLPFMRLLCVPVDVIHECMRFRLDHKPQKEPSALCIRQLIAEYKECMQAAVQQKQYFLKMLAGVVSLESGGVMRELLESEKDEFEADLRATLEVYFQYLLNYVNMLQCSTQASKGLKNLLEQEWQFVKELTPYIRGAEAEAGRRFCVMASGLLEMTGDFLGFKLDKCCSSSICDLSPDDPSLLMTNKRHRVIDACRQCKQLFHEARERASKALGFAKMLRKDLEIAAEFACNVPVSQLLEDLKALDHLQVRIPHMTGYMILVPHSLKDKHNHIITLLNVTCGREDTSGMGTQLHDGYMLFLSLPGCSHSPMSSLSTVSPPVTETNRDDWLPIEWTGPVIDIMPDIETTIGLSEVQVGQLKLIVSNSSLLLIERKQFQRIVGQSVTLIQEQTASHDDVAEHLNELKESALKLGEQVLKAVSRVENFLQVDLSDLDETERVLVHQQYVPAMLSCFNFGFEYSKEVSRLVNKEKRDAIVPDLITFAMKWMDFVIQKCERGRGTRPRWATAGLEFLILVGELSASSQNMTDSQFQSLKTKMSQSIEHLIGSISDQPVSSFHGRRNTTPSPIGGADRRMRVVAPRVLPHSGIRGTRPLLHNRSASFPLAVQLVVTGSTPVESCGNNNWPVSPLEMTREDDEVDHTTPPHSDSSNSSGVHVNDSPPSSVAHGLATGCLPTKSASDTGINAKTPTQNSCSDVTTPGQMPSSDKGRQERQGTRMEMIQQGLRQFDAERNRKLQEQRMIGQVCYRKSDASSDVIGVRVRHVNFPWQRGRKIGEGRFGKVYACINMETGDLMAVKEVRFQGNSHSAIKEIVDEIKILEGILHLNVVRYYGVEVHKEEMFIFMEYCGEGTIWHVAKQGLPEAMIRSYTHQILVAIEVLHRNGVVHRDIKGPNIFLSTDGLIKLGDFGCSVKLQNINTTMPGEIDSTRGTVAYMAPEVITNDPSVGSGRAADIWSLGCVVVEMATGKRPWPEYDHEYCIIFQVGNGNCPKIPDNLGEEGKNFLRLCFKHDPNTRSTASALLDHPFVKIGAPNLQIN
ncbi:mitogen-activated protein kinase kinase kinase 4-like isoform X2 [Corticium candelabrum]|uniref:mitogen-activated protein kinase kinase kinase 4-like isoform X2 n=1 Tax=Corticium candelabrum TaxID=121492 RepID=UPI002E268ED7|nr:mitogen-activated protein kinase kinase kinase 4-like isoform X2 [Corticium candelabrum]